MKKLFLFLILLMNINAMAQRAYSIKKDSVDGGLIFNGPVTIENLKGEPTFTWMKKGFDDYKPDEKSMSLLRFYLRGYSLVVFLGTWCDDTHKILPGLAKVLTTLNYPLTKLTMYGTDRAKTTINNEQHRYEIVNVPTIIVFKDDLEVGRITENVKTSVEADLAAILEAEMASKEAK